MAIKATTNTNKFGLFEYRTENIGDEIQSIAARRFLPKIDQYVNRDDPNKLLSTNKHPLKVIMNGWYMHEPENWPPLDDKLHPLLVSMHVDIKNDKVVNAFTSKRSVDFLKKYGPVGARDKTTLAFFKKHHIPAYFSGCLTLTLEREKSLPRQDYILAVDISKKLSDHIQSKTKRPVINLSVYYDPDISREARFYLAEYFLSLYQSAHCVITTRLHATLPSLALETPVLLIKDKEKYDKKRYSGLAELARSASEDEYLNNPSIFNVESPPKNKDDYLKYRNELIDKCTAFTGYSNPNNSYKTISFEDLYHNKEFIKIFAKSLASTHKKILLEGDLKWAKEQTKAVRDESKNYAQRIAELESLVSEITSSHSWKLTAPLRTFMHLIGRKKNTRD